jgi:diadenosine tetraphosphate (Ap4A) HIT family hydrolase
MKGELVDKFGYFCVELKSSNVYIFKEQSHPGRVIVAHKKHVSEIIELTDSERNEFFSDVNLVAKAIHDAFNPDKLNYGMYGDTGHHLHIHLCPKYKDQYEWGGVFLMNPHLNDKTNEECELISQKLKASLKKFM